MGGVDDGLESAPGTVGDKINKTVIAVDSSVVAAGRQPFILAAALTDLLIERGVLQAGDKDLLVEASETRIDVGPPPEIDNLV